MILGYLQSAHYYHQHQIATKDEKKFIKDTGNKWKDYCNCF